MFSNRVNCTGSAGAGGAVPNLRLWSLSLNPKGTFTVTSGGTTTTGTFG